MKAKLEKIYREIFGGHGRLSFASVPGRVELLGEHTDLIHGKCIALPISRRTYVVGSLTSDPYIRVYSLNLHEVVESYLYELVPQLFKGPKAYLMAPFYVLKKSGYRFGVNMVVWGDIPVKMGLGSSASLLVAVTTVMGRLLDANLSPMDIVKLAQEGERDFVKGQCHQMDHHFVTLANKGCFGVADCLNRSIEWEELHPDLSIIIALSGRREEVGIDDFAQRQKAMLSGISLLKDYCPDMVTFRDIKRDLLNEVRVLLAQDEYSMLEFAMAEYARIDPLKKALKNGELDVIKQILQASYVDMKEAYKLEFRQVQVLINKAINAPMKVAFRPINTGFSGGTVNFVKKGDEDAFISYIIGSGDCVLGDELQLLKVELDKGVVSYDIA